jgi:hypothetical protein
MAANVTGRIPVNARVLKATPSANHASAGRLAARRLSEVGERHR